MATIRFTGLASGLDTEKMVKEMMKARKEPMNRLLREKQTLEWKRDSYREMNSLLLELRTSVDSLRFSGNFNKKQASSENDNIASVNVVGTPKLSSYAVEVKQLAQAEMPAAVALTIDPSLKNNTKAEIGSAFTLTVNGQAIQVEAKDSIESVVSKINAKTSASNVQATLVDGQLHLTSASGKVGSLTNQEFSITTTGDSSRLGIAADSTVTSTTGSVGQKSKVVINGIEHEGTTNKITFDGVEFTLKQKNVGSAINVSNKVDEDAVFNTIKDFVNKYNDIIAKINKEISEPRFRSYKPLLDEEKEALPDKTVDKMEEMAKSGLLLRESTLKSALDEMRRAFSTAISGTGVNAAFDTMTEIGIGGPPFGKNAYQENGKLYIDEKKLRSAIRNNGAEVTKLFTNFSDSTNPATKYKESGIAERLYSELSKAIDKVTGQAGSATSTAAYDESYLGKKLKETNDEIDRWEDRLKDIENRYYKQFATMEKLMAKSQSQSSWFAKMSGQ
ncbi:flagellar filament capping protein FliD [Brevibacillus sp. 179-C9.3 HS]|uniref:flagellar filament capping protein FliD n=1 Tax=unclassified Brevibacillus TaxID=2684853 RepID=UPI0039A3D218